MRSNVDVAREETISIGEIRIIMSDTNPYDAWILDEHGTLRPRLPGINDSAELYGPSADTAGKVEIIVDVGNLQTGVYVPLPDLRRFVEFWTKKEQER